MALSFKESGDIHARLGEQWPGLVTGARFSNGRLSGSMPGRIDTEDASRRPWHPGHHLDLDLKLRGDVLNGAVVAIAGCALGHWCELRKKGSRAGADQPDPTASPRRGNKT
jgi:hypothetical protein